ncbi:MAG: phosphate ABC transporter substrate-binding/OmpA family protein [Verrucomicrobiales bacterium]|nr:phosphate ABC transporter substrate-binding/OmpA family protein [Verrucomicrobiales bacterium]
MELQSRFAPLEEKTGGLEGAVSSTNGASVDEGSVKTFQNTADSLVAQAESALRQGVGGEVTSVSRSIDEQIGNGQRLKQSLNRPDSGSGVQVAEAKQLVMDIQLLQEETEAAMEVAMVESVEDVAAYEDFEGQIGQMLGRARKIAVPRASSGDSSVLNSTTKRIDDSIAKLSKVKERLSSFAPAPESPFNPDEAEFVIGAPGKLGAALGAPIAAAWGGGEAFQLSELQMIDSAAKGKILVKPVTLEEGFRLLSSGELSILLSDQPVSESELASLGVTQSSRSIAEVIALDALTFLAHPDNAIDSIELGTSSLPPLGIGAVGSEVRRQANRFGLGSLEGSDVSGESAALAEPDIVALGLYHNEKANLRAKRLTVKASSEAAALKPSPFTIATEDYPLSYRVVAWTRQKPSAEALSFVKFATSDAGQEVVAETGFVDLRLKPMQGNVAPEILAALGAALGVDRISSAVRLSTNLRFETGKSDLDLKAQADLERLPRYVARSYPSHKVVILGFTDSVGTEETNRRLSIERAEVVATELRKSQVDTRSTGLGPAFPVDTNATEEGKAKNRRAEVWVAMP